MACATRAMLLPAPDNPDHPNPTMSAFNEERVLSVLHWADRRFTSTTTREPSLRFSNGHFTMTGLAPFMSLLRDPETYARFAQVIRVHGVRLIDEPAYREFLTRHLPEHEFLGEVAKRQLRHDPTVTREPCEHMGRVPERMESGKRFADLGLRRLNPSHDRAMICGSPALLRDLKAMREARGVKKGSTSKPGGFVIERAFVAQ